MNLYYSIIIGFVIIKHCHHREGNERVHSRLSNKSINSTSTDNERTRSTVPTVARIAFDSVATNWEGFISVRWIKDDDCFFSFFPFSHRVSALSFFLHRTSRISAVITRHDKAPLFLLLNFSPLFLLPILAPSLHTLLDALRRWEDNSRDAQWLSRMTSCIRNGDLATFLTHLYCWNQSMNPSQENQTVRTCRRDPRNIDIIHVLVSIFLYII